MQNTLQYAIRWSESVGRRMALVTKQKEFSTESARDRFVLTLEGRESFVEILAWSN